MAAIPEPRALTAGSFQVGDWIADPALDELRRGPESIKLEPRAMRVLCHLAERQGEVVSADELLDTVWAGLVVGQNSVYQVIAQLRRVFADNSDAPAYLATVPRKGYRLIAAVAPFTGPDVSSADPPAPEPVVQSGRRRADRQRIPRVASMAGGLVLMVAVAVLLLRPDAAPPAAARTAVAVLPFADLSPDKSNQSFCDGLTDELINSLARVNEIRVTARTSAFSFRDQPTDVRAIGATLGVTHIVEGSVRREGTRIRIAAHLVNVSNGFHEWSETFDRPFDDVFEIQENIARAVVGALEVKLSAASRAKVEPARAPTANAYELYLLGRFQQLQRQPQSILRAIDYHRAAIELDPSFALAYAGLASAYMYGLYYANFSIEQATGGARVNVAKALAANPELAEGYAVRGSMHLESFELAAAEQDYKRALALKASYPEALIGLGMVYEYRAEPRRALAVLDEAAAIDPLYAILYARRCLALQNLGRYAEAERACLRMIELQPSAANGYWGRGLNALAQGKTDAAIRGYRAALERTPERTDLRAQLARLYFDLGMPEAAVDVFPRVARENSEFTLLELERARKHVVARDARGLKAHLDAVPVAAGASAPDLFDAALLELVAGRLAEAAALCERARGEATFSVTMSIENVWMTRWGRSDGVTLAAVALATGNRIDAERYLDATSAWLDRVDRNGQVWHGAQYLRASVLALRGQPDAAMRVLHRARELGWRSTWWMRADPALASLRDRDDFRALLGLIDADNAAARARLETPAT